MSSNMLWMTVSQACGTPEVEVWEGMWRLKKLLRKEKVNLDERLFLDGNTALHEACYYERKELVALLLQYGADTEVQNKKGQYPRDLVNDPEIFLMTGGTFEEGKVRSHLKKRPPHPANVFYMPY